MEKEGCQATAFFEVDLIEKLRFHIFSCGYYLTLKEKSAIINPSLRDGFICIYEVELCN